jgi:hypothetical protein
MRHHVVTGAAEPATARGGQLGLGARGVRPTLGCHTKFCVSPLLAEQAASFPLLALLRHADRRNGVRFRGDSVEKVFLG